MSTENTPVATPVPGAPIPAQPLPVAPVPVQVAQPVVPPDPASLTPVDPLARQRYEELYGRTAPTATAPATPQAAPQPTPTSSGSASEEVIQLINNLQEQIRTLEAATRATPQQNPPVASPEKTWVELISEGKIDEGTALLRRQIASEVQPEVLRQVQQQSADTAYVEAAMNKINAEVATAFPEAKEFESYIESAVEKELLDKRAKGEIQNRDQFVEAYRAAVSKHASNAKETVLRIRGVVKTEAQTVRADVMSGAHPVPTGRLDAPPPVIERPKTTADLIRERSERNARIQGLPV